MAAEVAFKIMQEAGSQAHARRERLRGQGYWLSAPGPKRVGVVRTASTEPGALLVFLHDRYPEGHAQFRGARFEWRGRTGRRWRPDDGQMDARGREWSVVVTLQNGAYVHEHRLLAWRES